MDKNIDKSLFEFVDNQDLNIEESQGSSLSFWTDARIRFSKNKASVISLFVLVAILLTSIIAPFFGAYYLNNKEEAGLNYIGSYQNVDYAYLPPRVPVIEKLGILDGTRKGVDMYDKADAKNYYFIFGTDNAGRDLFVRVSVGTLISVAFGLIAALFDIIIGIPLGGISGYFGGKVDLYLQRFIEILGTVPRLIWVFIFVMYFGAGFVPLVLSLLVSGWIPMYRVVRAQVYKIKEQEFILSSKTLGGTSFSIIFKHILPNTIGIIIIWLMFTIPGAIFFESFLSYLGMGISLPTPSLGSLTNAGRDEIESFAYILLLPTLSLSAIMLSFNLIADGLRDAFDPKMRGGK